MIDSKYKKEPIKDFPEYKIDTLGNVYNKNGSLKNCTVSNNYKVAGFIVNGKKYTKRVNRLVAI